MNKRLTNRILLIFQVFLLTGGSLLLAKPVYHLFKREYVNWHAASRWRKALEGRGSGKEAAWLRINKTDIDTLVLNSDTKEDLYQFPIFSKQPGNLRLIMAHRDIHFRQLGSIEAGNEVDLTFSDNKKCSYEAVDFEIIDPDDVAARLKSKADEKWLVLMTCYPFYHIGPAPKRFLVWCLPKNTCLQYGNETPL